MVHNGSRPLVRLAARFAPALDGGSSVLVSSFWKDLSLVAEGPRVGRRYGDVIPSIVTTGRRPRRLARRRRVHRGRSSPGPPSASMWWLGGAPTQGPRRSRIVFVCDGDEAPDGGPPLVEFLRSWRKVEEQLRTRRSFCWRGWRRQLRGLCRALTSNHVRKSSITTQQLRAIFTSTSAGMLNSFVLRTMHRALPTAVSGVFSVVTLLVARTLGRARCGRRRGRLRGCCAARGWHNDTPGGPRAACGGPSSVFGLGSVRPVA